MTAPDPVAPPVFVSSLDRIKGRHPVIRFIGRIGSVYTAATLIVVVGATAWIATYYEAAFGREATAILVYQSSWFNGIFLVLAAAVIAAVVVRWPLKRHQYGFAVVHLGLLTIIAGFAAAGRDRLDGMLLATPGKPAQLVDLPVDYLAAVDGDQARAAHVQTYDLAGFPSFLRFCLHPVLPAVRPGINTLSQPAPVLELPTGTTVAITRVAFAARHEAGRAAAPTGEAAVRVGLWITTPGQTVANEMGGRWLTDGPEEGLMSVGPLTATFARTRSAAMAADLGAVPADLPKDGILHVYWRDQAWPITVDAAALPSTHRLSDDCTVTIERAIAKPAAAADGQGLAEDPEAQANPVLKISFTIGSGAAVRTNSAWVSAFSLLPALPGDWPELLYEHPELAVAHGPGQGQGGWAQLLAGPDGVLHVRTGTRTRGPGPTATVPANGTWRDTLVGGAGSPMRIDLDLRWLPTSQSGPEPVTMRPEQLDKASRWIEVLVRKDGAEARAWLARGSRIPVMVGGHEVLVHYDQGRLDLQRERGFAIRLERFEEGRDPGGMRSASYASDVTVVTKDGEKPAHISMNEPLQQGATTLYQTAFSPEIGPDGMPTGRQNSIFTVAEDRGRLLKYLGSVVLVLGIMLLYVLRGRAARKSKS